eukprot:jgi/Botrbrau1/2652/Bobra.0203s0004.4
MSAGTTYTFGPTMRAYAGDIIYINLTNTLVRQKGERVIGNVPNGFKLPSFVNLHPHGLHTMPNPDSQPDEEEEVDGGLDNDDRRGGAEGERDSSIRDALIARKWSHIHHEYNGSRNWYSMQLRYGGGDNVFARVLPRESPTDPPNFLTYNYSIPKDHMPGIHWYHPHSHGAATLHTMSASGVIIVEDDPDYLPDSQGCKDIRSAFMGENPITERILILALWAFSGQLFTRGASTPLEKFVENPAGSNWTGPMEPFVYQSFDPDLGTSDDSYIMVSESGENGPGNDNPFCCVTNRTGVPFYTDNTEFLTVNGGYQPKLRMLDGVWQRWRMLFTGVYKFLDLTIVTTDGKPAPCTMGLVAKDGVYLMNIPRTVDHILLPGAGRAEFVIKCSAELSSVTDNNRAGAPALYHISSGYGPTTPSINCGANHCLGVQQKVVATLVVYPQSSQTTTEDTSAPFNFTEKGCTPLRPSYAPDLRMKALRAAGVHKSQLKRDVMSLIQTEVGCNVMGRLYEWPTKNPIILNLGTVQEFKLPTPNVHPFHLHISPVQLVYLPGYGTPEGKELYTSYFEPGDWHDTLFLPMFSWNMTGFPIVRMQPGAYAGYAVLHCHILQHADEGCMAVVKFACPDIADPQPKHCPGFAWPVIGTYEEEDEDYSGQEAAGSRAAVIELSKGDKAMFIAKNPAEPKTHTSSTGQKWEPLTTRHRLMAAIITTRAGDKFDFSVDVISGYP